jgi:hypothetical protein
MTANVLGDPWDPETCTLPIVERPVRRAEFDDLFARDVLAVHHESPERIRLALCPDPEAVARAAGLAMREAGCCSFFAFQLSIADASAMLTIEAGTAHAPVLAALGDRAESLMGSAS